MPVQHWIRYLFGRVGGVWERRKRQICALNLKCKSILEWFYRTASVNLCFDRKVYQEYSSGVCTVVSLPSKYLRNDGATVVSMASNQLCPFQGTKQWMRAVL